MRIIIHLLALIVWTTSSSIAKDLSTDKENIETELSAQDSARPSKELPITVGGVTGFQSLTNPGATTKLRSSGKVGLYIHAEGWRPLDTNSQKKILAVFKNTGPAVVELGFNATPEGYFRNYYKKDFLDQGVIAETALVNGLWKQAPSVADRYIDAAMSYGLKRVAPVFAPNSGQYKTTSFRDTCYDTVRYAAMHGNCLSVDAPAHVFLSLGPDYQKFVIDEIHWAKQNHLPVYFIISANASKQRFFEETNRQLEILRKNKAMPSNLVFESYDIQRTDAANTVGSEDQCSSVLGVALNFLSSPVLDNWRSP